MKVVLKTVVYISLVSVFSLHAMEGIPSIDGILRSFRHFDVGEKRIMEDIQKSNIDINEKSTINDYSLLGEAAYYGYPRLTKLLLDRGAKVNVQDGSGDSPLHKAIRKGSIEVANLLLDNGADVGLINNDGKLPWILPLWAGGNQEAIKAAEMVKSKVDKEVLKVIIPGGQAQLEKLFDKYGAPLFLNWADSEGNTLLHRAILSRQYNLAARILAKFPGLATQENTKGQNALKLGLLTHAEDPDFQKFLQNFIKLGY